MVIPVVTFLPIGNFIEHINAVKTTYILPDKYLRPFAVVYNEPYGQTPIKKDGRWLMTIPEDGVLILDTAISYSDDVEEKYCYQNAHKELVRIYSAFSGNTGYVDVLESIRIPSITKDQMEDSIDSKSCWFSYFKYDTTDINFLDSLVYKKVDSCRKVYNYKLHKFH